MSELNPKLKVTKPKRIFEKSLQIDYRQLFKALSKGIGHTAYGKWEELSTDAGETLSAIGLETKPEELAYILIQRSVIKAIFELVGENSSQQLIDNKKASDVLADQFDISISTGEAHIDHKFFDRPAELLLVKEIQSLLQKWLEYLDVSEPAAKAIAGRLPSYFVYALNQEWRCNANYYRPLIATLDTPFAKAGERECAWRTYSALLQRRVHEGIFDEPFSLSQIYVPLNAFYFVDKSAKELSEEMTFTGKQRRRIVVSLQKELDQWLQNPSSQDAIRVISGGPGSGKSSFARVFAAKLSNDPKLKALYIPLHLIDPSKDLVEEVGRFVRAEGVLPQNPLDPESPEPSMLIIFDGLDELASQGKAAAETARAFIREIDRTVEKRNLESVKLRVLISGRELVVQENESEFRRPHQILTLLPYFVPRPPEHKRHFVQDGEEYDDPENLLKCDLRQQWWKNYGALTGKGYNNLPYELDRDDLAEVTAQPLLNYLVALSFTRDKLDFTKGVNLNSIYEDLVAAVHERGYEKHRPYAPIRHMKLDDFSRVLEEIGLAAWHGDGRTTTVHEIEKHCRDSGLGVLLEAFQEGAKAGVTRLLAAFFFRQYGQRPSGDPTFIFTHKSFGEYLTARRIVRATKRVIRELESRANNPDGGWDERDALKYWAQICGPSAISQYLHDFLLNEIRLQLVQDLDHWQEMLAKLFSYMLRHGMPMEQLQLASFREALFQSRNAEEALLAVLNACAYITGKISDIEHPDKTAFGAWLKRVQGQRAEGESVLVVECLSHLKLIGAILQTIDFGQANLCSSDLSRANLVGANLNGANLNNANLNEANLVGANLNEVNLNGANLYKVNLVGANLANGFLAGAILVDVKLVEANLVGANLMGANLDGANLAGANIYRAKLDGASLAGANLVGANLAGANLVGANLTGANLDGANLAGANIYRAKLDGDNIEGVKLSANIAQDVENGGRKLVRSDGTGRRNYGTCQ